jgi:hypothetical protein
LRCSREWTRWWRFLSGLRGSRAVERRASVGGVNGGSPLREGEREATGQCRFNGETKGGDSVLRFNSFQVREGDGRRRTAWQRRPGQWRLRRGPMKVMTPGSLTGWAHLSARGRRRPNRTSGAGDGRMRQVEQGGCENFQGNDLGYQGGSGQIDNGLWQILFKFFKQRFGF